MTVNSVQSRRMQSSETGSMGSSGTTERFRSLNASVGGRLPNNASWTDQIWKNNVPTSSNLNGLTGSRSLLAHSESDGRNAHREPWSLFSQTSGMDTSPIQSRSPDYAAHGRLTSSGMGPSPGTGHMNYLDPGSEHVSPSGEGSAVGNRNLHGRRNKGSLASFERGYSSPMDSSKADEQPVHDALTQRTTRNGYAHSSHHSVSLVSQRPSHSSYPSWQSEIQYGSRSNGSVDISANLDRLQLSEANNAPSRSAYISNTSWDSTMDRIGYQNSSNEPGYPGIQNPGYQRGYSSGLSSRPAESDNISLAEYPDSPYNHTVRPNGPNTGQRHRNSSANNVVDNRAALLQNRLQPYQSMEHAYQTANGFVRQTMPPAQEVYQTPAILPRGFPHIPQHNAVAPQLPQEPGFPLSSPTLAYFREHRNSGNFELKDFYGFFVEFSGDQHGSRFLQSKLESASSDEKDRIFREIYPNNIQLSMDVFGNYVIQKLYEHGNQSQKKALANQMKGQVLALSKSSYGCRVVQKALEHVLTDQQACLVKELEPRVLDCVKDSNGNHVIQKAIERVPNQYTRFIVNAFKGQVQEQATHPYGCRVIQRLLEHCDEEDRRSILAELLPCAPGLIGNQYGNYVIQHVIEHGEEVDRSTMIEMVLDNLVKYSMHKFASNVVEKSIQFGDETHCRAIIEMLTTNENTLTDLIKDQYGNYVVQKILDQLRGAEQAALADRIRPILGNLKKRNESPCKQIAAIEKFIGTPSPPSRIAVPTTNHASTTPPNSHKSSPQPSKRPVERRVMQTPPTPPPIDNQSNGNTPSSGSLASFFS
ncbi:armadillo-type protein [Aspergillus californicus]